MFSEYNGYNIIQGMLLEARQYYDYLFKYVCNVLCWFENWYMRHYSKNGNVAYLTYILDFNIRKKLSSGIKNGHQIVSNAYTQLIVIKTYEVFLTYMHRVKKGTVKSIVFQVN